MPFSDEIKVAGQHLENILYNHLPVGMLILKNKVAKSFMLTKRV
jgi:hypothetical protein